MTSRGLAAVVLAAVAYVGVAGAVSLRAAQDPTTPPTSLTDALPPNATGEYIFQNNCATCHWARW
jgi:mono/diheme cytochrome c family protein